MEPATHGATGVSLGMVQWSVGLSTCRRTGDAQLSHLVLIGWSPAMAARSFPDATVLTVHGEADVAAAVEVASAGTRVAVCLPDPAVSPRAAPLDLLVAELRRVGEVTLLEHLPPRPVEQVPSDALALLHHLAGGLSLGEAARRENLSRRTADRRLADARRVLGVRTTAQAIAVLADDRGVVGPGGQGAAGPARGRPANRDLIGRAEVLGRTVALLKEDRSVLIVGDGGLGKTALLTAATAAEGRFTHVTGGQETLRWRDFRAFRRILPESALAGDVEAVAARVEAAVGPDLLVVDDVHLLDDASLTVLCALAGRLTIAAAARPDPDDADPAAVPRLVAAGVVPLHLRPLADSEVATLARALDPGMSAERVAEVVAGAGGLPLMVEFLCGDQTAPLGRGLVPAVAGLPRPLAEQALTLALAARPLPPDPHSGALVRAGIADWTDDGLVRIRHALIAEAIVAAADRGAVADTHRRLGRAATDPASAALHFAASGDSDLATARALEAAEAAARPADRARLLAVAASACRDQRRNDLWLSAVEALSAAGHPTEVLDGAAHIDERDLTALDVGRLALVRARALWHVGDAEAAVLAARTGADVVAGSGSAVEAALLGELVARESMSVGPRPEHEDLLARAMAVVGDGPGRAALLNAAGMLAYMRRGEGLAEWSAGREAALAEGDVDALMRTSNNVITWSESNGDQVTGLALAGEMAQTAAGLGLGEWQAQFRAMAANLLMFRGRFVEALDEVEAVESTAVDELTRFQAFVTRAACLIELGLLEAAEAILPPAPALVESAEDANVCLLVAWWQLAAGRPRQAVGVVEQALTLQEGSNEHHLLYVRGHLMVIRAWSQHDLGRVVTPPDEASPTRLDGLLLREARAVAMLADDPTAAAAAFDAVADDGADLAHGYALRSRWAAAEARRLAGMPDAVDALLAVEGPVASAGMAPLLARVHRSLRLAGVRRSAARSPDRSGVLTSRERLVLDLVARGSSYTEIARRLGVGRPTVRRLVENARDKLGARDRLAAVAALGGERVPIRPEPGAEGR